MNNKKTITGYLFLINTAHLLVCLGVYLLRRFDMFDGAPAKGAVFLTALFIWFIFSAIASLGASLTKMSKGLLFSLLAVIPITLVTGITAALSYFADNSSFGWIKFFFLGSAVNFWFRPFSVMSYFGEALMENVYIIYGIVIVGIVFVSFLGCAFGISVQAKKIRKKRTSKKARKNIEKRKLSEVAEQSGEPGEDNGENSQTDITQGEKEQTESGQNAMDNTVGEQDGDGGTVGGNAAYSPIEDSADDAIEMTGLTNGGENADKNDIPKKHMAQESSCDEISIENLSASYGESKGDTIDDSGDEYVSVIIDHTPEEPAPSPAPITPKQTELSFIGGEEPKQDITEEGKVKRKYRIQVSSGDDGDISRFIEITKKEGGKGDD